MARRIVKNESIIDATEKILVEYAPKLEDAIYQAKQQMGVHHKRTFGPKKNRVKLTRKGGVVQVMSIGTNKGEILGAHKGVGGRGQTNRQPKPFINEPGTDILNEMADEITRQTGDIISFKLIQ
jgi:hypothetical protein